MPNIFISYRHTDDQIVERLAAELKDRGYNVWLDEWEIGVGDSIVEKIAQGLEGANYFIACFSASGMSDWTKKETWAALSAQLGGHGVKILPVLLSGAQLPTILGDVKAANLGDDWDNAMAQLFKVLGEP